MMYSQNRNKRPRGKKKQDRRLEKVLEIVIKKTRLGS